ncbi:Sorting nexin, cytoplasm-to-vacuole targeting pathway/endosomal sorting [Tulasnella sp. 419]|nr:Sorting nexin, cytoplasm-to-vacuole targeting pathway/endosomal sorting [Tulasnella sp. 418]KAG8958125.1 Sorting nexin, cytoplasm-to-vacuole targeting pathway/endosomal sorting [Tulasnella sp. 419]
MSNPYDDDENPFQRDDDVAETPSTINVSLDNEEPQPVNQNSSPQLGSQTSPQPRLPTFPSYQAQANAPKDEFCCARDEFLHSPDAVIQIVDALKTTEGATSPYITYVIKTGNVEARRRYSEFESLRNGLSKLYPTLIIPPIPSKQSIGDYAVKQAKAKEDATMISRRKRMLQTFLNRIARHPILSNEHVFHRFLDKDVSWSEVLNSAPLSLLPKNLLKAPSHNPTEIAPAYSALPSPPASQPLRNPDQRFLDSEAFTNKFATHLGGSMEKVTRRTMKRWAEYSHDHSELGAILNGFSLSEQDVALQSAIEKTGQAVDATYMSTARLLQEFETKWTEPLHEYSQFAQIIKKLLVYRHQKHVQFEMTQESLESKKEVLEDFERNEAEARRLEQALSRGRLRSNNEEPSGSDGAGTDEAAQSTSGTDHADAGVSSFAASIRARSVDQPRTPRPRRSSYGFFSALSYSLHGMVDVDPEAARRSNISKTRDTISQLEDALHASAQDLKYASSTIQADLDRFQRQKVADLREMTIDMARIHREWCKQVRPIYRYCSIDPLINHFCCRILKHGQRQKGRLRKSSLIRISSRMHLLMRPFHRLDI